MTKKIIYFTAGAVPTTAETAAIAQLNALTEKPFEVNVLNGSVPPNLGSTVGGGGSPTPILKEADYVSGTVPTAYAGIDEVEAGAVALLTVTDGVEITIGDQVLTFTVEDGVITGVVAEEA